MNFMKFTILLVLLSGFLVFAQNININNVNNDKNDNNVKPDLPISDTLIMQSLDFRNADIRDVLRTIATKYNINIWLSPEVTGVIPVHLSNIKVKDAIRFIVDRYGYSFRHRNGIIEIFKQEEIKPVITKETNIRMEGDKISFDLTDIEIDSVVRKYSQLTGINVMVDKSVRGNISGYLNKVDKKSGFRLLFENSGFEVKENNDVFRVSSKKVLADAAQPQYEGYPGGQLSVSVVEGKVKFEVSNGDLRQIISEIANQSGISIFLYGEIKGTVSARIDSVDIETAFRFLLENTSYTFWKNGSVYFIGDE
ncbi:MAG: hypothetical protein JNL74_16200, partial [Fibrobacteres bacterium]|nr:hypothetical protein [Fibrobacterota bacterium]